jgi:Fur family peroxide stress response transcriptional regulator
MSHAGVVPSFSIVLDDETIIDYSSFKRIIIDNNSPPKIRQFMADSPQSSVTGDGRLERMLSKLKGKNFRLTPQRLAVLKILANDETHPSVAQVYDLVIKEFPTTSLATVYKTIILLKELNEVLELGFPDGSNRYDGAKPFPHPHMICTRCKKIVDPELTSLSDLNQEMSRKTGFQILRHRLDFFGLCPDCQSE